ncbi:MAG: amidohydrolase, partial [Bacteroidetes bacterium]
SGTAISPTLMVTVGGPWALNYFLAKYNVYEETKLVRFCPKHYLDKRAKRFSYSRDEEHFFPSVSVDLNNIVKAGGIVALGSHSMIHGLGSHWEMWALAMGGMKPMQVLRAATISAATVIGRATDLGSLEVGKMADLIILEKNPLEDIHNTNTVKYVMRNGELYEAETLDQIWPNKKQFSPMGFWEYQKIPK